MWPRHCVKSVRIWSYSGPYSVQIRENTNQNNSEYGHFSRSERLGYISNRQGLNYGLAEVQLFPTMYYDVAWQLRCIRVSHDENQYLRLKLVPFLKLNIEKLINHHRHDINVYNCFFRFNGISRHVFFNYWIFMKKL